MKEITKSDNSKLFQEAEALRSSIRSELHCKARNKENSVQPINSTHETPDKSYNKARQSDA
ncbi:MAG: hypothetical protein ABJE79_08955 [Marinomonas sp.]